MDPVENKKMEEQPQEPQKAEPAQPEPAQPEADTGPTPPTKPPIVHLCLTDTRFNTLGEMISREMHKRFSKLFKRTPDRADRNYPMEFVAWLSIFVFNQLDTLNKFVPGAKSMELDKLFIEYLKQLADGARQMREESKHGNDAEEEPIGQAEKENTGSDAQGPDASSNTIGTVRSGTDTNPDPSKKE